MYSHSKLNPHDTFLKSGLIYLILGGLCGCVSNQDGTDGICGHGSISSDIFKIEISDSNSVVGFPKLIHVGIQIPTHLGEKQLSSVQFSTSIDNKNPSMIIYLVHDPDNSGKNISYVDLVLDEKYLDGNSCIGANYSFMDSSGKQVFRSVIVLEK